MQKGESEVVQKRKLGKSNLEVVQTLEERPRTMEQLTANLRALKIALSDETLRQLDEIWPGPGGEAPTAHAW
jgi:hypothetical protein